MEPTVHLGLGEFTDSDGGDRGVAIDVTNRGTEILQTLKVEWVHELDAPQRGDSPPLKLQEIGRRYGFSLPRGETDRPLEAGGTRTFLLAPAFTQNILTAIRSDSPGRHSIQITLDGKEESAIPEPALLEFMTRRFPVLPSQFQISKDQLHKISNLIGYIVESASGYKVFPPREVIDDPAVLQRGDIVDRLADTKWWLRFKDGREEILTLVELMCLTYEMIAVKIQLDEAREQGGLTGEINVSFKLPVEQIMTPDGVRTLLSKIELEGIHQPEIMLAGTSIRFPLYIVSGQSMPLIHDPSGKHLPVYTNRALAEQERHNQTIYEIHGPEQLCQLAEMHERSAGTVGVCFDPVRKGERLTSNLAVRWEEIKEAAGGDARDKDT